MENTNPKTRFEVLVDDNFDFYDESKRYKYGEYDTYEEAVKVCKEIVDRDLLHGYKEGESAAELYSSYTSGGEDPFIRPNSRGQRFSAWEYAKLRCDAICYNKETSNPDIPKQETDNDQQASITYYEHWYSGDLYAVDDSGEELTIYTIDSPPVLNLQWVLQKKGSPRWLEVVEDLEKNENLVDMDAAGFSGLYPEIGLIRD